MIQLKPTLRRLMRWTAILSIVVVVYSLTVGPALLLENRTQIGGPLFEFVYAPVFWLGKSTPLRDPIQSYLGYFDVLHGPQEL
jgi:hypothetical protein